MLSFFRKKSIEPTTNSSNIPTTSSSKNVDLMKNLGYNDVDELKNTVYGMLISFVNNLY